MKKFLINFVIAALMFSICWYGSESLKVGITYFFITSYALATIDSIFIIFLYVSPEGFREAYYSQTPEPKKTFERYRTGIVTGAVVFLLTCLVALFLYINFNPFI